MTSCHAPVSIATSRRRFLKSAAIGAAGLTLWPRLPHSSAADAVSSKWLTIEKIDRTTLKLPYRETPARSMARELPHWQYTEIVQVTLKSGATGVGETLLYYTWGVTGDEDVQKALGANAAELMWDDGLGAGLQIALFDAVARTAGVPVHALLGSKLHDRTPLSWWNIDTPPDDMVSECREALQQGYLSYKTKGRPWFDLWAQIEQSAAAVPPEFKIDMDFNDTLLDADRAIAILEQFEKYPQVDIWETPIPQKDLDGNRRIAEAMRAKVAMHYGNPEPKQVFAMNACDGFVVGGGASTLMKTGAVCEMEEKPFWLQLVGTGITAAFSLHFGGVLRQSTWPAVNCHQLYVDDLLTQPLLVEQGTAAVPDRPGLGYELDLDAVERFRTDKPASRPDPERLLETTWPDGRRMYVASNGTVNFLLNRAIAGEVPYFERGVTTRLVPDDGTSQWRDRFERAGKAAVFE